MNLEKLKKLNIPEIPGCYQYFNTQGEIIYIGKAANLKSRIFSYWQKNSDLSLLKTKMLEEIERIKWIDCGSEMEALLLEANLVKKNQPSYNILLRDDKRFAYIKISNEEVWPRIYSTRSLDKSGHYFGPFTSGESIKIILKAIRRIWPYRSCRTLPKRPCLYYHVAKCPGMCANHITPADYQKIIKKIITFLEGGQRQIISQYEAQIVKLIKSKKAQEAETLIHELFNIKKILEQTNLISKMEKFSSDVIELAKVIGLSKIPQRIEGYDIAHIFGKSTVGSMVVFEKGEPNTNEYKKFKLENANREIDDTKMLKEVIERRFKNDWPMPDLILVDGGKSQLNAVLSVLKKMKIQLPVISISKGQGLRSARAYDKLHFPGEVKPLELSLNSPALHILKRVRDESHRFAITYHRKLRSRYNTPIIK